MRNRFRFLPVKLVLLFLCAVLSTYIYAQEEEEPEPSEDDVAVETMTPEQNRIDMDIKTSTLSELAAWCRSLGLPEAGTSADLANRLREYYEVVDQIPDENDNRKIITIESARSSEYFKIETVDEDYARLSGDVIISLKDGDAIHRISAWNILFNRTRNTLTATGNVEYIKEDGDSIEKFHGESITVNLDDWSSVFLDGISERSLQSGDTVYEFAGTIISRDEEESTILSKATIRTANNPDSLWSLNASRVWLLPGSDFAILNAVLKVGEIPVLYIPFFYYPADEVIFHPVIGSRPREGSYVQTTTYILGRPKASSSSEQSLTKILGNSSDMEKRREGLFLRSTGKKIKDPDKTSLKAIVDWYANLGVYIGTDLEMPAKGILGPLNLNLGIGLTRTIDNVNYTPYFISENGTTETDWNNSNLFSREVPFRYRFETNSSISGKYGRLAWDIPFYSDPLVNNDFLNRAEEMDWVNMIQQGAAGEEESSPETEQGNYSWQLTGQITPRLPGLSPYINNISISNITSSLLFRKNITEESSPNGNIPDNIKNYRPSRFFYAPETATLYSLSGSITGVPLTIGGGAKTGTQTDNEEIPDVLLNIGVPRSPFEDNENEDAQQKGNADLLVPPELTQRFDLPRTGSNKFFIDYRILPTSASTLKFNHAGWKTYDDIDWSELSSILSNVGGNASIAFNVNHSENLYTNTFTYEGNGTWRQYDYLNEEADDFLDVSGVTDPNKVSNARLLEYRNSHFATYYNVSSALRPLYWDPVFGNSSLEYNLRGLAVKSDLKENATAENPEWDMIWGEWDKEKINQHQFKTTISASVMDKPQTFSLTADMPPIDPALAFQTFLRIWITETSASMRIRAPNEDEKNNGANEKWKLEPFIATEQINFGSYGNFRQSLTLDTENVELTLLNSQLSLPKWGITASYTADRELGWEYIPQGSDENYPSFEGWRQKPGEAKTGDPNYTLKSRDFSLNFAKDFSKSELWGGRLQFSVNVRSGLFFDLQRYTNSRFTFSLGFTLGINKFIDLSLSADSKNNYIYRYFKDIPPFNSAPIEIPDGPQNNLFLDLFNSFAFHDEELRSTSGFKLDTFKAVATHHLGDWNAILEWSMAPYRPPGGRQFEMNSEIRFLLQWIPITEIKADVTHNKIKVPEWMIKQ